MRRLVNPVAAIIIFSIGVSAAAIWQLAQHQNRCKPERSFIPWSANPVGPPIDPETERHAVYSALIKDMYVEDGVKLLVLERGNSCQTASKIDAAPDENVEEMRRQVEEYAIKELPELKAETIVDFNAKAKDCYSLNGQFDIPVRYVLVSDRDLEPLFPKGEFDRAWKRFYARYPHSSGIISFSNIGFNREMNQALVSTGRSCGGPCGAGYYVLLTKENGFWRVHSKTMTWVS